jgi:hypothetical protein
MKLVFTLDHGEESAGLVYEMDDGTFAVYEIPLYGGEEQHLRDFDNLADAVAYAKSLT